MWTANGENWTLSSALGFGAVCLCLQQWNTTDNNNSLNVNNRSLEFIDKTHRLVSAPNPQTLPPAIALKGFWWILELQKFVLRAVRLEAIYFLGLDFSKFRLGSGMCLSECSQMHNLQTQFVWYIWYDPKIYVCVIC